MLKSLFEYVVGLSKANMVTIDGVVYTDKPLHLPELPTIETLHTDNLSSIVNFIKNAWDAGMNNDDDIVQKIIHVEDAGKVNLYSSVCNEYMDRQKFMTAEWAGNKFPFGQFMDAEKFNILLQTCFMETDDLKVIQQVVGNLRDEAVQCFPVGDNQNRNCYCWTGSCTQSGKTAPLSYISGSGTASKPFHPPHERRRAVCFI